MAKRIRPIDPEYERTIRVPPKLAGRVDAYMKKYLAKVGHKLSFNEACVGLIASALGGRRPK